MNRIFCLIILLVLAALTGTLAQNKKLSLEDAVDGQYSYLYPAYLAQFKWIGSDTYSYVSEEGLTFESVTVKKSSIGVPKKELYSVISEKGYPEPYSFPIYEWRDLNLLQFEHDNSFFIYDVKTKKITSIIKFEENAENIDVCSAKTVGAYTVENDLYIIGVDNKPIRVTNEDNPGIVYGQEVHRREFGIEKGTFWSPKGNFLAFYRKDETMVSDYPLVDVSQRVAGLKNIKYPMAGMASHQVTLGVYNLTNGKTVWMETGEPKEQYLTNICWSPDEKFIFISVLNREQNHMKLNKYDANTGKLIKTLFEEEDEKYVEPENPPYFLKRQPDKFIFQSERTGFNHLYLYDTEGKMLKQLTDGNWMITEIIGFDENEEFLYYMSTEASPIERHAYKLNMKTGERNKLTKEKGTHGIQLSPGAKYLYDNYSSMTVPKRLDIMNNSGTILKTLLNADDPLADYKLPEMKVFTIKAADGKTDLYCRLIKPANMEKDKKYPAIVYVYGGPHAQLITDSWLSDASLWQYYMAQEGYIMLTVDNRGSAGRGLEFENCIHRQLGKIEMEDQMKGIDYLKSLGYVDMERIGVHGWSYGGFMTTSLMLNQSNTFKVGVAGGPVIDWKYYEIMYGERYMDTPQENPKGYEYNCLVNHVDSLKGRLLQIHGCVDPVVVWQHSLVFLNKCVEKGKMVDYFVYPSHEHNVRGYDRLHLMRKITLYFNDFL